MSSVKEKEERAKRYKYFKEGIIKSLMEEKRNTREAITLIRKVPELDLNFQILQVARIFSTKKGLLRKLDLLEDDIQY